MSFSCAFCHIQTYKEVVGKYSICLLYPSREWLSRKMSWHQYKIKQMFSINKNRGLMFNNRTSSSLSLQILWKKPMADSCKMFDDYCLWLLNGSWICKITEMARSQVSHIGKSQNIFMKRNPVYSKWNDLWNYTLNLPITLSARYEFNCKRLLILDLPLLGSECNSKDCI